MTFTSYEVWWWPYLFILLAGWLATDIWRYLGVYFAGDIDENAEILVLVRALATALVAAVIAKLVLYPEGALAQSSLALRLAAVAIGFAIYRLTNGKVWAGVLSALSIFLVWQLFMQNN
ncbi:MAG: AzlD domain-containing protein [Rhizobiaceae bacterium]